MNRPEDEGAPSELEQLRSAELTAVRLLARREHSADELRRKLAARGHDEGVITALLQKLMNKKLVSDDRFAASAVHHHARRGKGPVRIRATLRQQGVEDCLIAEQLAQADIAWTQRAREVRARKFGSTAPRDPRERAKQARFLQYRGFSTDQIRAALSSDAEAIGSDPSEPDSDLG